MFSHKLKIENILIRIFILVSESCPGVGLGGAVGVKSFSEGICDGMIIIILFNDHNGLKIMISVLIASAYAQTHLILHCSRTQSMDVGEGSDENLDLLPRWIRHHWRLKWLLRSRDK